MNCIIHPEKEQLAHCELCGESFCSDCLVKLGEHPFCKKCLQEKISAEAVNVARQPLRTTEKKSKFWAFIFSIIPGVGYLYLGLMNRGLQTMMLFFGSIFVASFMGFEEIMALVAPVVIFYSIFDTQQATKAINSGVPVEDKQLFNLSSIQFNQSWIGYALIVIGGLALLNNVMPYLPYWSLFRQLLPPVIIIGLGVAILYRNTSKQV